LSGQGRLGSAIAGAHRRVWYRPHRTVAGLWSGKLTLLVLASLVMTGLAALTDAAATSYVRQSTAPVIGWMAFITDIGRSHWYLVPAAAIFLGAGLRDWAATDRRGRARLMLLFGQAGFAFAAVALSGLLVNVLKFVIGRGRPRFFEAHGAAYFEPFAGGAAYASFPSGHSTTVGAVTAILMMWFPRFAGLFAALGIVIAATRVAARAHYPSDVAAGFTFGLIVTIVIARFLATRGVVFRLVPGNVLPSVRGRLAKN
jgi:undecaprenyl-diphosphatase